LLCRSFLVWCNPILSYGWAKVTNI
jgi:hypothetical protein